MTKQTNNKFRIFIIIWAGIIVSAFGTELTSFSLGVWVYEQTNSATQFALISVFATLPGILISPLAGTLVDRWDRRWVLIISDSAAVMGTVMVAGLLYIDQLQTWHIYLATTINSLSGAFFRPAFYASMTLLVPKQQYGRANGMLQSGFAAAQIISPMLAGVLVLTIELWRILLIDFAAFSTAIIILLLIRIPKVPLTDEAKTGEGTLRKEMVYGWTYIRERAGLFSLLIFFAITNFIMGIIQVLITPLVLGFADAIVLGRILSAAGVGMLLGGIVMSSVPWPTLASSPKNLTPSGHWSMIGFGNTSWHNLRIWDLNLKCKRSLP